VKIALLAARYPGVENTWLREKWDALAPLGLGYLAAHARKRVEGVEFLIENATERVIDARPDLVGVSFVTMNSTYAAREARKIKEALGCPILAGGPHVSTLPTVLDPAFDAAVLGEGEETFVELLRLFTAEGRFTPQSLAKAPGVLYRDENGALFRTEPRPLIADLNTVPYPDRELMRERWLADAPEIQLVTSRGCLFNCAFCSTVKMWGRGYRYPSNEYVVGEVEQIRRDFDPEIVHFYDDLFIGKKSRVLEILKTVRERGLHEGVRFRCHVRADLLDDELAETLARTNFDLLGLGIESGSDNVLRTFNKESVAKAREKTVELARKHGLEYTSCFIVGAPGETREDLYASMRFALDNMDVFRFIQFGPLVLLPGTEAWEWGKKIGVSETNLRGIAFEPEDFADEKRYYLERWPYLNETRVPREEIYEFFQLARSLQVAAWRYADKREEARALEAVRKRLAEAEETARRVASLEHIARNAPILDILKAKVKRRLGSGK